MNLLVLSDSHGRTSKILEAYERQIKKPDALIFLGDGLRDLSYCDLSIPIFAVSGNCDGQLFHGNFSVQEEILMTLEGKRIMMTHGDAYNVKSGLGRLILAAKQKDADIVLFGHTHIPYSQYLAVGETDYGISLEKPLYLFNPGSIGGYESSFGTVDLTSKGILMSYGQL